MLFVNTNIVSLCLIVFQDLSVEEEQPYLNVISRETRKLKSLKESHQIELSQKTTQPEPVPAADAEKIQIELQKKAEQMAFDMECKRDADEKKSLLQAVINESSESGYPMPPSLIKLLNHNNGKCFFLKKHQL